MNSSVTPGFINAKRAANISSVEWRPCRFSLNPQGFQTTLSTRRQWMEATRKMIRFSRYSKDNLIWDNNSVTTFLCLARLTYASVFPLLVAQQARKTLRLHQNSRTQFERHH